MKKGDQVIGNRTKVKVVKNKVAPPYKQCIVEITYGKGISKYAELADLGVQFEIFKKSGNWYEYEGNRIANGKEQAKAYLEGHPEVADEVEKKILDCLKKQTDK